jgi:hypothetical protein
MNVQRKFISCICLLAFASAIAQSPVFSWAKKFGGSGEENAVAVCLDDSMNTYVTGFIDSQDSAFHLKAMPGQNIMCVDHDIFLAKYDAQGTMQWLTKMGAASTDIGWAIANDRNQYLYTASTFMDTVVLNGDSLISRGYVDGLIAKHDMNGNVIWAKSIGGTFIDNAYAISTDSKGNVYVTGSISDTTFFGDTSIINTAYLNMFVAKYDESGNLKWIRTSGGTGTAEGYGITVSATDEIYLTGKFETSAVFDGDTLAANGNADIFVTQYDTTGNLNWIRIAGSAGVDYGSCIKTSPSGDVIVGGDLSNNCIFGIDTIVSAGGRDAFVARYDESGNLKWVNTAGGSSNDDVYGIAVGKDSRIYITGSFTYGGNFGTTWLPTNGSTDAYAACIDSVGIYQWAKKAGGMGGDFGSGIAAGDSGDVVMVGVFESNCMFDSITLNSIGGGDLFVAKINGAIISSIKNESTEINFNVYPNPFTSEFVIQFEETNAQAVIKIYNVLGQQIDRINVSTTLQRINLSSSSPGIYLVEVNFRGESHRVKMIKQ